MLPTKQLEAKFLFYYYVDLNLDNLFIQAEIERVKKLGKFDLKKLNFLKAKAQSIETVQTTNAFYLCLFWYCAANDTPHKGNIFNALYPKRVLFTNEYVKNAEGSVTLLNRVLEYLGIEPVELNPRLLYSAFSMVDLLTTESQ